MINKVSRQHFNVVVAQAAACWTQMDIPVRFIENGRPIEDPRTESICKSPVETYFFLQQHPEQLTLALITGPETGLVALDAYTYKPGVGMEALENQGYFCNHCQADGLIRHEGFQDNTSAGRFHTVLYYSGKDQFLESAPVELPGVFVRKSGDWIPLPPSEIRLQLGEDILLRSSFELESSIAPAGITYLPDGLREIIRSAERQKISKKNSYPTLSKVKAELYNKVFEGSRDTTLTRRAGYLIGYKKLSRDDAFWALRDINNRCCVPPLPDNAVRKIVKSIYKKHQRNG